MLIAAKNSILTVQAKDGTELLLDAGRANTIARANGYADAEKLAIAFNEKTLVVSDTTSKILQILEEFI